MDMSTVDQKADLWEKSVEKKAATSVGEMDESRDD